MNDYRVKFSEEIANQYRGFDVITQDGQRALEFLASRAAIGCEMMGETEWAAQLRSQSEELRVAADRYQPLLTRRLH